MATIAIMGTGAWGTTLARLIALEQVRIARGEGITDAATVPGVVLWEHQPERAHELQWKRENRDYLPGFPLPANLRVTADLADAVRGHSLILLVTPSQTVRENARALAPLVGPETIVVSGSKGIELGTHLLMTQVLAQELPRGTRVAALSGPNLAIEIARGMPAAAVVAARDHTTAEEARTVLNTARFRIYTGDDVVGIELGGALKNIIALGVGISDGLAYGDNAKASFMTRALAEISRLALAAGANPLTLAGLAGPGDPIAPRSNPPSRHRTLGLELAKGRVLDDVLAERKSLAEGVTTTRAALEMAADLGVELPITAAIASVLFEGASIIETVSALMLREPKRELEGLGE